MFNWPGFKYFNTFKAKPFKSIKSLSYKNTTPFVASIMSLIGLVNASNVIDKDMFLQNILSALRGPDNGHDNFKWLTTARIRAITCSTYAGNINFGPLNIQEMQLRDKLLYDDGQAPAHFSRHYDDACWAIRVIFGYDLREEQKLSAETWQALLTALRK